MQVIRSMFGRVGRVCALLVLVGVVLLARALVPDAAPDGQPNRSQTSGEQPGHITPIPTLDKGELPVDEPPPTPPPPDRPIAVTMSVHQAPAPIAPAEIAQGQVLVVLGRVVEILPPRWTTPDGQRPANPWQEGVVPYQHTIITPVVLELEGVPLVNTVGADVAAGRVVMAAVGGKVGADSVTSDDSAYHYEIGERVLVVLDARHPHNGDRQQRFDTPAGLSWNPTIKWLLTEDGQARWYSVTQPADELIAAYRAAAG